MAFIPPQGNKTVMVDNSNNIVYPASFQKVVATQATIAGNNFTSVPSVIDPENATTTQLPSVASVVSYVADVVEGGSSGLIPAIQSDIQTLGQDKSNRGEFWFKEGTLTCTNKWTTGVFSFATTFTMTEDEYTLNSATSTSDFQWLGTCVYSNTSDSNAGFFIVITSTRMQFFVNGQGHEYVQISDTKTKYADGKPHVLFAICDGTSLRFQIDNEVRTIAFSGFRNVPDRTPFKVFKNNSKLSRIKYFNFDMSADDAPYTIDDYIAGKDESPFLHIQSPSVNWRSVSTGTGAGNTFTFTTDTTSTSNIYPFYNQTFKGGVEYEFVFETQSSNPINIAFDKSTYVFDVNERIATNLDTNQTETLTTTGQYVKMCNGGHNRTIVRLKCQSDFSLFTQFTTSTTNGSYIIVERNQAIGALLSLDDYSIKVGATKIVPDVSGNNNDATIEGSVYGSKDNSIAKMAQLFYQSQQG